MRSIALLGGTGPEGRGLALRLAMAGIDVLLGSRDPQRAAQAAGELNQLLLSVEGGGRIVGAANADAAGSAEVICPVVPFRALPELLAEIAPLLPRRMILDVTNPIVRVQGQFAIEPLPAGSTAEWICELAPQSIVVSGFKNLSAEELLHITHPLAGDILFCSDSADATATMVSLTARMTALRGIDAGPLRNARFLEGTTALLMNLNRRHKATTSIRILGL
ncbi:MAG TPA: NADPH-dependent F420 reductase [Terriglobales bacterium]|nr:NADPH-dependent F420 reductase [Terriglobales bacterium]